MDTAVPVQAAPAQSSFLPCAVSSGQLLVGPAVTHAGGLSLMEQRELLSACSHPGRDQATPALGRGTPSMRCMGWWHLVYLQWA